MPSLLRVIASRLHGLLARRRLDDEFAQEIAEHLALATEENIRRGMTPAEAAREARLGFGGATQIREDHREYRGFAFAETALRDLRYAARTLRRSPGFTVGAVLTLALGIGLNVTFFTAFNAVALKPIPVRDPDSVVRIARRFSSGSRGAQHRFSVPEYLYYRDHDRAFSALIAAGGLFPAPADLPDRPRLRGQLVSANYFSALGIPAAKGRTFLEEDDRAGAAPVVVLSDSCWRLHYEADPLVVGRVIHLNGAAFMVIGVTPDGFIGTGNPPQAPDFWTPLPIGHATGITLLGRLRPDVSRTQAQAGMTVLARQFEAAYPVPDPTTGIRLERAAFFAGTNDIRFRFLVTVLMLLLGTILLIACANLANMLLARAAGRRREIGLRLALGASRGRLIRQLLTESLVLSLAGGAGGLLISMWASRLLWVAIQPSVEAFLHTSALVISLSPDMRVFAYTFVLAVVAGVAFGLAPALEASRRDVYIARHVARSRLGNLLLTGQVTASMIFLITAGLLARGLLRSQSADPGFETRKVFLVQSASPTGERPMLDRLRGLPQVKEIAQVGGNLPLEGTWTFPVVAEWPTAPNPPRTTLTSRVSGSYFATLEIPILAGRTFTRAEGETKAGVAVISAAAARRFWPGENPLGRWLKLNIDRSGTWSRVQVIGIAKDVRNAQLSRVDPSFVYLPTESGRIVARIGEDSRQARLPGLVLTSLEDGPVRMQRLLTQAYAGAALVLACLAVSLAAIGIYGVMAYLVSQRTREIGIRMALGARRSAILGAMAREGLRPVFWGAGFGLAGATGVAAVLRALLVAPGSPDMLFGASAFDPAAFAGLTAFMAVLALAASSIPAWRAVRVDPVVALRAD